MYMERTQKYIRYLGGGFYGNHITKGKIYLVMAERPEFYYIHTDFGHNQWVTKYLFQIVK